MPPKRQRSSSESHDPTPRRSLPSRSSRPARAAMRDGSEEDEIINEVTTTPLEKVIRESMRTARKDFGLKSDDDIPLKLLGPGSCGRPRETPLADGVVKRKRGRPRKNPLPEDASPSLSMQVQKPSSSRDLLREIAATDADTESDGSGERPTKARFQRRRPFWNIEARVRSPDTKTASRQLDKRNSNSNKSSPKKPAFLKDQSTEVHRISSLKLLPNELIVTAKQKPPRTRSLAPELVRKSQHEISEDEYKPAVKGIIKKKLVQSAKLEKKSAKSVTLEVSRRGSNSSDGERVYPKRNLPQKNYDQIKRRVRRRAETDWDASSGFDSDRGSLPNLKTPRIQDTEQKRISFGSENSMPVLSAVSPANLSPSQRKPAKEQSPKDSTPALRKLLSSQVTSSVTKGAKADLNTGPRKALPSPSKNDRLKCSFYGIKAKAGSSSESVDTHERIRPKKEILAVTKTMTKRPTMNKTPTKARFSNTSESKEDEEEEHMKSRKSHPAVNYCQNKKYAPRKSVDSSNPQKPTPSRRKYEKDWISTSSAPKEKSTDESSSEEEIIPRTTKSRAVPFSSRRTSQRRFDEKEESEESSSVEEVPTRARRNLPKKSRKETEENKSDSENSDEEEEHVRPRRQLPTVDYSPVKRRKRKPDFDDEDDSQKSEEKEPESRTGSKSGRASAAISTSRKRPRQESESKSKEESSEEEQKTARKSFASVNYLQTTPRKRLPQKSESDESSAQEESRLSGGKSVGNAYKTTPKKKYSTRSRNLSRTPDSRNGNSSEESLEDSSDGEQTPVSRKAKRFEPIFPQRVSSESSDKEISEGEDNERPKHVDKKKLVVKIRPRRPQTSIGRNNYFSSSSSEDERFNKTILQEAQSMVKESYEPILKNNVAEMDIAYNKFLEDLVYFEPKEYKLINKTEPLEFVIPEEVLGDDEVVTRVSTKAGHPTGSAVRVNYISTTPTWPRMKSWIYIEHNIKTDDSLRLSHIPYIDDEHDSVTFVRDLKKAYPEGIHGTLQGWGKHISDYLVYQLLKDVIPKWKTTKNESNYLFQAIYKLFPNKLSARQLEHALPLLEERFQLKAVSKPAVHPRKDDIGHSIKTIMCVKCLQYHCLLHGVSGEPFRMHRKAKRRVHIHEPCGDECYLYLPEVEIEDSSEEEDDIPKIEKKFGKKIKPRPLTSCQGMFNKLVQVQRYNACHIAKMISCFEPRTCTEVYYLMEKVVKPEREMSPDDIMQRKLSMKEVQASFRHLTWNLGGGRVDNSEQPHACKHPGACSRKHNNCVCARFETLCSKYCCCGVDCKLRFPGCRCQPGQCRTKQCQCFYAKWECDPDVCKSCNCGAYGGDEPEPEDVEFSIDGVEDEELEEEIEWLEVEYPPQKPVPEDDVNIPTCSNINLQRGQYKRLKIGKSDIAGYGCFIEAGCEKGDFIAEYTGEVISKWEAERRGRIYDEFKTSYIFALNKEQSVDATRMGNHIRFANHSDKEANCYSQIIMVNGEHRIGIFAKRRLYKNEELLFDYQYNKKWKAQYCPNERNNQIGGNISSPEPSTESTKPEE